MGESVFFYIIRRRTCRLPTYVNGIPFTHYTKVKICRSPISGGCSKWFPLLRFTFLRILEVADILDFGPLSIAETRTNTKSPFSTYYLCKSRHFKSWKYWKRCVPTNFIFLSFWNFENFKFWNVETLKLRSFTNPQKMLWFQTFWFFLNVATYTHIAT